MSLVFMHCNRGSNGSILQKLHSEKIKKEKKKKTKWLIWS